MAQAITDSDGRPLRLHTRSAGRIEVHDARVEGDSVIGRRWTRAPAHRNAPVAVPLADVQTVEEHRVSAGRTALAVAGAAVGALAVLALIATSGDAQIGFD